MTEEQLTSEPNDFEGREAALDRINDDPAWAQRAYGAGQDDRIVVPQRTLDEMDGAMEAIRRAQRELISAVQGIKSLSPDSAVLLKDDANRLSSRVAFLSNLRKGSRS